jgi:hypothetical protein
MLLRTRKSPLRTFQSAILMREATKSSILAGYQQVVLPYNPSYWRIMFEAIPGKSYRDHVSTNKPSMMVHICNPSYAGDRGRRIKV